jgi:AcrR family transcriptional regulator
MEREGKTSDERFIRKVREETLRLVTRSGDRGWSMDDLAIASGLTKRSLYRISASKERAIEEALLYALERGQAAAAEALAGPGTMRDRLSRFMETILEQGGALFSGPLESLFARYPGLGEKIAGRRTQGLADAIRRLYEGGEKGELRAGLPPAEMVAMIQAVIGWYVRGGVPARDRDAALSRAFKVLADAFLVPDAGERIV